jgi:hypothetical protein
VPPLPWSLVKAFVKLQCDIVDRFETGKELLLYVCLLCLMDREGRIRGDFVALAARIRWTLETVQDTMEKLMQPNPASKCKKHGGACVVWLDPQQPHLGLLIPAATRHRKRNAKTEARKLQQRLWAREKRRHRVDTRRHASTSCRLPPPSMSTNVDTPSTRVDKMSTAIERESESIIKKSPVANTLGTEPSKTSQDPDLIHSVDEVLALICEKVYDDKIRKNQIGQDTVRLISEMLPFSREQIDLVADYMTLPADECWPELKKRRALSFNMLIRYWADQVSLAIQFDQKYFA